MTDGSFQSGERLQMKTNASLIEVKDKDFLPPSIIGKCVCVCARAIPSV